MKSALQKSPIPHTHAFTIKALKEPIFDPIWHFHSEYQLFIVLKGSGTRFIGDNIKPFKKGDITFTGPNLPHLWRSDNDGLYIEDHSWSEGIVIYFHDNFVSENFLQKEEALKLNQLLKKSSRGIDVTGKTAKTIQKMFLNLLKMEGFDRILEVLKILNCLSQTDEIELLASPGYMNTQKDGDSERMNKVYVYVMKNFKRRITVLELAELTNMAPTSFSRYFKIHANKTFSEFVSEIRIGHACKLLIEKKMDISQTCYNSGFQTLSNFNRQFKAITNRTPLAYKKEYLIKATSIN